MLELFVIGVLVFVGLALFGALWAVASLILWVLLLPFKLLGLVFRGLAFLLVLPFLAVAGVLGALFFGAGMLLFFIPALPLVLIALGVWWLLKRRAHPAAHATQ